MTMRICSYSAAVRASSDDSRTADVIASDSTLDSYDETIDVRSWKLDRYRQTGSPVLANHDSRSFPIGTCETIAVRDGKLVARVRFATAAANPLAEQAYQLAKQGILRGASVGFRPGGQRLVQRDGRDVLELFDCDLMELSLVSCPANPAAGIVAVRSAGPPASVGPTSESDFNIIARAVRDRINDEDRTDEDRERDAAQRLLASWDAQEVTHGTR